MSAHWGLLAPLAAIAITLTAMQVAVLLTNAIRRYDYGVFEDQSRADLATEFPLPLGEDNSPAEERRRSLGRLLNESHQSANQAQTTYHNAVVRSAGCLVLAFLALATGAFHPEEWDAKAPAYWVSLELLMSWLEIIAFIFVLVLFRRGEKTRRPWIVARVRTELLRQYQILSTMFPAAMPTAFAGDLKKEFEAEADLIAECVEKGPIEKIVIRLQDFWRTRKESIISHDLTGIDLTKDALLVYLKKRALRQLGWFTDSKARLEHFSNRRARILFCLYWISVALALTKHTLFMINGHSSPYLLPLLLIVAGMSAAMTAYYISQNSRSLIHRYNAQERSARRWLEEFKRRWGFTDLQAIEKAKSDVRLEILRFEDLMVDELSDWLHITSHDAIELG
jgi:hypothetical protein